jgi:hypothetical protein
MTRRFQLLPGARGLDFENGDSVRADRRGAVTLTDEQAAKIKTSSAKHRYDSIVEIAPARFHPGRSDPTCSSCGRTYWGWQKSCGKCGASLEAVHA